MNIGLLFGSFNPVHTGHLALAEYLLEFVPFDEVWFVVTPQNPFKEEEGLEPEHHRLEMVKLAIQPECRFRASDVEFKMPRPSYTIDTLNRLSQHHPTNHFSLIVGSDNLANIDRWKASRTILNNYPLVVYPRPGYPVNESYANKHGIIIALAPLLHISSTWIRENLAIGKKLKFFLPPGVYDYIQSHNLYKV